MYRRYVCLRGAKMKIQQALAALLLFTIAAFADDEPTGPTVVRYFVQLGGSGILPMGSLNGKTIVSVDTVGDTSVTPEHVAIPKLPTFAMVNLRAGAYVDASTVTVGIGYGRPMLTASPASQPIPAEHAQLWNFDFEYQYHFGYPGIWRPAIGASYGFTRMTVDAASIANVNGVNKVGHVLYSGAGPALVTGLGWYGYEHFAVVAEARFALWPISYVTTTYNDFGQLKQSLYEFMPSLSLSLQTGF